MLHPYACEDTLDKIFALSYEEVTNFSYGFSSFNNVQHRARQLSVTDCAKCLGCSIYTYSEASYCGGGSFLLCSPYYFDSLMCRHVDYNGTVSDANYSFISSTERKYNNHG